MPCANCRRVLTALPNEDGNINGGDRCGILLVRNSESDGACVGQTESIQDDSISEAISTVFEASLKLHKKLVSPDCRLLMCFQCLSTLTTLNSAYKKFMKLTVEGSYVQTLLETSILWSSSNSYSNFDYDRFEDDGLTPMDVKLEPVEVEVFPIIKEEDPSFAIEHDPLSTEGEALLRNSTRKRKASKLKEEKPNNVKHFRKILPARMRISTNSTSDSRKGIQEEMQPNIFLFCNSTSDTTQVIQEEMQREIFLSEHNSASLQSPTTSVIEHPSVSDESAQNPLQSSITADPVCPHGCGETSFSSEAKFRQHMICVHGEKATFKCEECGKIFYRRSKYRGHLKYKHGHGLTAKDLEGRCCPVCHKIFETKCQLRLHQTAVHNTERPFECDVEGCGRKFPNKDYLSIHRYARHKNVEEPSPCEFCGKLLRGKHVLQIHIKTVHDGIRDVICEICGKACATKSEVKKHLMTHDKSRQKNFNCKVCNKAYVTAHGLRKHVLKHSGVKSEVCSYCGDTFFEAPSLRRHMIVKHGVRPKAGLDAKERHECPQCGKVFKLKDYLRQHLRSKTHGGRGHHVPTRETEDT